MHAWAESERQIPVGTSPEPGRWRSAPYQQAILEAISDPGVEAVLYLGASQGSGKTEVVLCTAGYYMAHEPAPMLVVEPNLDMAESLSKDRLAPMISATPCLRDLVRDPRTRDSGNTVRHKEFPAGHITLVGANSASGLSMRPIRVVLFDEIDRFPPSAGTEGDPVKLAETRATRFWNRKFVYVTSPGWEGGRSWLLWEKSDKGEFYVPCPACQHKQILRWAQVQWTKDEAGDALPESARYVCERCGDGWDDVARWRAIQQGEARPTAKGRVRALRVPAMSVVGFELSRLVIEWYESEGNFELRKVFINTRLCEWWSETHSARIVDETGLYSRREPFPEVDGRIAVPAPAAILTAGVDVQDNRFEISVYAWGPGEESWCIAHHVLFADPSVAASWADLGAWLDQPWPREAGGVDYLRGVGVDTGGHHTQAAYDFCSPRFRRVTPDGGRVFTFALKGSHGAGEVWPRKHSNVTSKVPVWIIRTDPAKEQIYGRLSIADPGPGYVHFHEGLDIKFFEGLTAQRQVPRTNKRGFVEFYWELRRQGLRDEPLDCAAYAYASLCGLKAMGFDLDAEVDALGRRQVYVPPDESGGGPPGAPPVSSAPQRGSWLGDTRGWLGR